MKIYIYSGALAVECRSSDKNILEMLEKLICHKTQCRILAERSFLKTLGGGCSAPVAVQSTLLKRKNAGINKNDDFELEIIGAVWSLDGKTEMQSTNACSLNINRKTDGNDVEDVVVPPKKIKLSTDVDNDLIAKSLDSNEPSPPQIIDHSQVDSTDTKQSLDFVGLINVHNDAFKKCPHSSILSNEKSENNDQVTKCPLEFSVGEDVMGECPYFDKMKKSNDQNIMNSCETCPYKNATANADSEEKKKIASATTKCPFLTATTSAQSDDNKIEQISNENPIERLFCGIYPHHCWSIDVFEKCEQLGKDLAVQLIEKGALSVMECAQNEIRQKL